MEYSIHSHFKKHGWGLTKLTIKAYQANCADSYRLNKKLNYNRSSRAGATDHVTLLRLFRDDMIDIADGKFTL